MTESERKKIGIEARRVARAWLAKRKEKPVPASEWLKNEKKMKCKKVKDR